MSYKYSDARVCNACGELQIHASKKSTTCIACTTKGVKWCNICHTVKPLVDFDKQGLYPKHFCKSCGSLKAAVYQRQRYSKDSEYREQIIVKTAESQSRRRRGAVGTFTYDEWKVVLDLFDNECAYCGSKEKLTVDHVIPLYKGGPNDISNLIPACKRCNCSKNKSDVIDWYRAQDFYDEAKLRKIAAYIALAQLRLIEKAN